MAKVAKESWLWPCLSGFTRPPFSGKRGQKRGKPGLASLFQAGRVFGRAPDASIYPRYIRLTDNAWQTNWQ